MPPSRRLPWIVYPGFAVGVVGLFLLLVPPYLLPSAVYDAVYGWRFPQGWECGDALITDRGPRAPAGRFSIDVGEQRQDGELEMCRLPDERLELMVLLPPGKEGIDLRIELLRRAKTEGAPPLPVLEWSPESLWQPAESPVPGWSAFRVEESVDTAPAADYLLRLRGVEENGVRPVFVGGGWRR